MVRRKKKNPISALLLGRRKGTQQRKARSASRHGFGWANIGLIAAVLAAGAFFAWALMFSDGRLNIYLKDGGRTHQYLTWRTNAGEFLTAIGAKLDENDTLSVAKDAELTDGETIEITRAYPIAVQSGGNTEVMYLSSGTVGDALDKAGVTVKSGDEISELTFRDLEPGMKISHTAVDVTYKVSYKTLDYDEIIKKDDREYESFKKVEVEGKDGKKQITQRITVKDGVEVSREVVDQIITEKAVDEIIRVGTKIRYQTNFKGETRRWKEAPKDGVNGWKSMKVDSVLFGETTAGAVVVMNPKTGAIEAMSSWPGYDLNAFAKGISSADYAELLSKANKPLYNRLTQGLYPPGSVLKAFTAVAALQSGTLDENYVFTGEIVDDYWLPTDYGTWLGSKIKRTQVKYGRLSPLNMRSAIVHSDNIYFANAALLMGWDNYTSYMKSIGFGDTMPFDLNVAQSQLYNDDTELTLMLLADSGYGQGEILTTPLQMATMFCAFANGGNIMQPYIVDGLYETEGIKYNNVSRASPKVWKSGVIEQHSLDIIVPYLKDVVDHNLNGTGRSLKVTSVTVAAKTGTAEIGNDKSRQISWFAGFRCDTEDKDARLVLVMLEVPTTDEYASLKFDIAREMLKMSASR